jgi:hypothetical protein
MATCINRGCKVYAHGGIVMQNMANEWICLRRTVVRSNYFTLGTRVPAYRAVDNHVYDRMRNFLARRHKVGTRGSRRFSRGVMFGEIGVLQMTRVYYGSRPTAL